MSCAIKGTLKVRGEKEIIDKGDVKVENSKFSNQMARVQNLDSPFFVYLSSAGLSFHIFRLGVP